MANAINVHVYRFEIASDGVTNVLTQFYNEALPVLSIAEVVPVNTAGGEDLVGAPYIYGKIVQKQFGMNQEFYVMNNVQDIQNKMNS